MLPCMNLTPSFAGAQGQKEDSLEGKMFQGLSGSNGAFVSWCSTRERFQEGIPLRPLGLSLWKLSRGRVRLSSLLILTVTLPSLSAMADLYPSMVLGCKFLTSKRQSRKSATDFTGGALKSA